MGHTGVRLNGFDHLLVDAQHRVQRHQRVLKNHGDAVAAQLAHLLFAQVAQVLSFEQHLARDDLAGRVDQPKDGETGDRFSRAGFAHEAHNFAGLDRQVHTTDGGPSAFFGVKNGVQAAHCKQGLGRHVLLGSSAARSRSAITLMVKISSTSAKPGNMLIQ